MIQQGKIRYFINLSGPYSTLYVIILSYGSVHVIFLWFCTLLHYRFGIAPALKTTKRVQQGQKFLFDYNYTYANGPEWYQTLDDKLKLYN